MLLRYLGGAPHVTRALHPILRRLFTAPAIGLIARAIDREIEFRSCYTRFETLAAYMPRFVRRYMLRWHNSHHCDLGSHYTWKRSHWVCDSNDVPVLDGCYQCDPPGRPICWECGTPIILLPGFPDDACLPCHRKIQAEITGDCGAFEEWLNLENGNEEHVAQPVALAASP